MQYPLVLRSKWKVHQRFFFKKKKNKAECPDIWIRLPKHKWPKSWSSMEDPVVPLERNLYGHLLAGLLDSYGKGDLRKFYWNTVGQKSFKLGVCVFVNRARGLFLSVYVDAFKLTGKTENTEPTETILMKGVDLGEPTSFLDHAFLGCTQRECTKSNDIVTNYLDMFESRISAGAKEKLPRKASGNTDAETISSWSYDMDGHAKKCVEKYCEFANKTTQQLCKAATPCMDDRRIEGGGDKSVGEFSTVCSHIVLKCLHLARIGRLDILWSVNKLARAVTKMDKSL